MASQKTAGPEGNKHFTRDSLFDLSGKVALVTGGGSGIGLMATQALASNGAKVYITGRTGEKLDSVVEQYGKNVSGEIIALPGDVASKDGIEALVRALEEREKCLCILVNNAGVSSAHFDVQAASSAAEIKARLFDAEEAQFGDWTNVYRTNVSAPRFPLQQTRMFRVLTITRWPAATSSPSPCSPSCSGRRNGTTAGARPSSTSPASAA